MCNTQIYKTIIDFEFEKCSTAMTTVQLKLRLSRCT